jgi:predicted nucleotidyltransferase component of viral defense system
MTRPLLISATGFAPSVVDKAERLLEVLSALREDPFLGELFVLHGGTALNLFHDTLPRLSVDIDLMFVGAAEVEDMRVMRPEVHARFREVVGGLGYAVHAADQEHSGQTYRVKYPGNYVKVDVSYLARVALLAPEALTCAFADPPVSFPVLQMAELAAGKVKAVMERVAARDLFDLYRLSLQMPGLFNDPLARAVVLRAVCAADPFPRISSPVEALKRFQVLPPELAEPLAAMLRTSDSLDYSLMLEAVRHWLSPLERRSSAEVEFAQSLAGNAEYRPELLFADWPEVLDRARRDPVMAWKVQNLAERPRG